MNVVSSFRFRITDVAFSVSDSKVFVDLFPLLIYRMASGEINVVFQDDVELLFVSMQHGRPYYSRNATAELLMEFRNRGIVDAWDVVGLCDEWHEGSVDGIPLSVQEFMYYFCVWFSSWWSDHSDEDGEDWHDWFHPCNVGIFSDREGWENIFGDL